MSTLPRHRTVKETIQALQQQIKILLGLDRHHAYDHDTIADESRCEHCRARAAAVREVKRSNAFLRRNHERKEKVSS